MSHYNDLIKNDSAIKGLNIIFDSKIIAENINQYLNIQINNLKMTYIRYHPMDRCLVSYVISSDNTKLNIYAKSQKNISLKKNQNYNEDSIQFKFIIDPNVELRSFSYDKKLESLRFFATKEQTKYLFSKLFPENKEFWDSQIEILVYMPEKRLVLKLLTQNGKKIVLKFCKSDDFIKFETTLDAFSSINFPIQKKINSSDIFYSIAYDWIEGTTLYSHLSSESNISEICLHRTGITLAKFHKLEIKNLSSGLSYSEKRIKPENLLSVANQMQFIYSNIFDRTIHTAKKLISILPNESLSLQVPIHGDFSAKNVIMDKNGQIYFIDIDESTMGNNLIDVSKFIANLKYWMIIGNINKKNLSQFTNIFLNSYQNNIKNEISKEILQIYVNLQLFTLLRNPFRLCLDNWKVHTNNILSNIEKFLNKY